MITQRRQTIPTDLKEHQADWWKAISFVLLMIVVLIIIYYDDIQITSGAEAPTIYNLRIIGLKVIDLLALSLTMSLILSFVFDGKLEISQFHKNTWE